ncbi:hypothetical protein HY218_01280 [Candidatus Saccharibacteria bacterium]|nr:hypothetical protein [Candidatus Saccharibacteria bacterium]
MSETSSDPREVSPNLGVPLLTDEQKRALLEQEDRGLTPAPMHRYKDFEDWLAQGGTNKSLWMWFYSGGIGHYPETQCRQRFDVLYPELATELTSAVLEWKKFIKPQESANYIRPLEPKFFDAYNKLADLVDINDKYVRTGPGEADIDRDLLMR